MAVLRQRGTLRDQLLKQGTVMDQGLSKVVRACLTAAVPQGDIVPGAIMLDHIRVVDRNIASPLLEVADGIATRTHHLGKERVGIVDRSLWIVDEGSLYFGPAIEEPVLVSRA